MPKKGNKAVNNTLAHVASIMTKYYRVGKRNRFKSKAELKAKSKEIWETFKAASKDKNPEVNKYSKVTIKNLKHHLGRWQRGLPQAPELPPDWNKIRDYWELDDFITEWSDINIYPKGYVLISEFILGYENKEEEKLVSLKSAEKYTYEDTFKPFVDYLNRNSNINKASGRDMFQLSYVDVKKDTWSKKGEIRLRLKAVNIDGMDLRYGFTPKGVQPPVFEIDRVELEPPKEKTKEPEKKEVKEEKATSSKVDDELISEVKLRKLIAKKESIKEDIRLFKELGEDADYKKSLAKYKEISKQIEDFK